MAAAAGAALFASPASAAPLVQPADGDAALLADLRPLRALFGSHHLSDVLFVFASESRAADVIDSEATASTSTSATTTAAASAVDEEAVEHHLLPAHRLVLALRSGTFRAALQRSASSHVPSRVRFPLKIHVRDTPFRVFAALVGFLYTNEVADASGGGGGASERQAFWQQLLRASFVYLVPSLLELCVAQIERLLGGDSTVEGRSQDDMNEPTEPPDSGGGEWDPERLRRVFDVLVFADSVLAARHPVAAPPRRASKKPPQAIDDLLPPALVSPRANGRTENGLHEAANGDGRELWEDEEDEEGDGVLARCLASVTQLQGLCTEQLKAVPEHAFAALVHSDVGRRCSTARLCAILTQRSDTPLVVAVRYQLGRVVNELLKRGEPLDAVRRDERDLPLVAALKTGNDAIVRRLLVAEHAPYFLLTDKVPVFYLACASGSVLHCQILLDQSGSSSDDAASKSATAQVVNMVSHLDEGGKEIVAEFGRGQTPLHVASRKGHAAVVELLLRHGAVANLQDDEGNTALHGAGAPDVARILLTSAFKTNPNIPNRRGQTPLHVAAAAGSVAVVDLLIRSGCQQDIVDDQGQTAFHVAAAHGHTAVALVLLRENEAFERSQSFRQQSEKVLLANGDATARDADARRASLEAGETDAPPQFVVNQEDLKGNTALHLAAMSPSERCQKMLQLLLENGADPNRTNWFGYTPLHLFCSHQSGPESIIDVFIEHGVDIHVQSLDGSTALHLAVGRASEAVAVALVIAGAQVHLEDAAGRSVVALAETTNQGAMLVPVLRNLARPPEWAAAADDQARECAACRTAFRMAMRKHHCRHCGRGVCYNCSSHKIPIPKFQLAAPTRVCDTCFDVLSYRRLL
ncbi:hypothetical protein PybrP1_010649 [[Pythium] brassicae (nom. inval.)]|nr:hypothetical protein PybrP1_010649 [[Pythium] brassicae (nom. inval.)]